MGDFAMRAGQYDGLLGGDTYATVEGALMDLARVMPGSTRAIFRELVAVEGSSGFEWYVYRNAEDADGDDGSGAIAVITEREGV